MEEESPLAAVRLATSYDLGLMKEFLAEYLPDSSCVYNSLATQLTAPTALARVYLIPGSFGDYHAISYFLKGEGVDENLGTRKIWRTCHWARDDRSSMRICSHVDFIDWTKETCYSYGESHQPSPIVKTFFLDRGMSLGKYQLDRLIMEIPAAMAIEMRIPPEVYVKSLERCHASVVYEHWPYSKTYKLDLIADEIDRLPSAGVFLKDGDRLVSWIVEFPPNGLSKLHTLEPYRGRGYASLAVMYMSKRMAQCGRLPFAHVMLDNDRSRNMFQRLGFRFSGGAHITIASPQPPN